jgi:hypothetical protein
MAYWSDGVMAYWIQHDDGFLFSAIRQHANTPFLAAFYSTLIIDPKGTLVII